MKANFAITEAEYLQAAPLLAKLQSRNEVDTPAKIELKLANGTQYPHLGKFDFVNREISSSTGTIQITALFPNPDSVLRPGLFARITAPSEEIQGALLVPQASTVELQGNFFVVTLGPGNVAKPVFVKLGPTFGQLQVVTGPLKVGDKVVVGGVEKARPGTTVNPQPYQAPTPSPAAPTKATSN
jgi:RND family efflux transporter MFP subunit